MSLNQRWSTQFNIFALALKFGIFVHNQKIGFMVFLSIVFYCCPNRCSVPYNMFRHASMGSIRCHYYVTGFGAPDISVFVQCVNIRDPMENNLWSHGLYSIYRDICPTALVEIPPGIDIEFVTGYLIADGRRIRIIGKDSVTGSVKFTGSPEVWGSSLIYISDAAIPDTNKGWGWTGTDRNITGSTVTGSWVRTIHSSPDNSPRIPVFSSVW